MTAANVHKQEAALNSAVRIRGTLQKDCPIMVMVASELLPKTTTRPTVLHPFSSSHAACRCSMNTVVYIHIYMSTI